jgi:hypothetical protein
MDNLVEERVVPASADRALTRQHTVRLQFVQQSGCAAVAVTQAVRARDTPPRGFLQERSSERCRICQSSDRRAAGEKKWPSDPIPN